ncbi:MAG TPA: hypothetical protein VFX28_06610, partial [Methylomirabilota bacterium]|nr:hypothetical protein [Methylomirabilota bacterium]
MMNPLALVAGVLALQAVPGPPPALLAGEAVKVDLGRRLLVVRTTDPPRETSFQVDAARTRLSAGGRTVPLTGVRPGEWVLVAYEPAGAQRMAVLVKVGAVRPS